jgi:hypothetical protein
MGVVSNGITFITNRTSIKISSAVANLKYADGHI